MLLTHEGWKEAKVAVVARGESIIPDKTTTDDELAALDSLVRYYRNNEKRTRCTACQRWSMLRGRRMVQLRALYRTAGPRKFHWAIREALRVPLSRPHIQCRAHPVG